MEAVVLGEGRRVVLVREAWGLLLKILLIWLLSCVGWQGRLGVLIPAKHAQNVVGCGCVFVDKVAKGVQGMRRSCLGSLHLVETCL